MDRNYQEDRFLRKLDKEKNKIHYVKIVILDKEERPIKFIEGEVQQGSSISINGNSAVRRTCNLTLIATKEENDLVNIENELSANKKIKILIGIEKNIDYSEDILYYADKENVIVANEEPFEYGFPKEGEKGIIYADRKTKTYWRWNGKEYQKIKNIYNYDKEIAWFQLGVFVITQPSISHTVSNCTISLSCKDKMCLLNGEAGGTLPASVTFHEYDQVIGLINCNGDPKEDLDLIPNEFNIYHDISTGKDYSWTEKYGWAEEEGAETVIGTVKPKPNLIYDIIKTLVINYGGETESNVFINDVPLEIKQLFRYTGSKTVCVDETTGDYFLKEDFPERASSGEYSYNEDIGYEYTDFIYPEKTLISGIGESVCSVLDKIKNVLGNFEYFYDVNGHFIFQEKRNYLNNSYNPEKETMQVKKYYLENSRDAGITLASNNLQILGAENYRVDYYADQKSVYTFEEGDELITSYSNTPNYMNLKNDYHVWGKGIDNNLIHYHVVIKKKPVIDNGKFRKVVFLKDENEKLTGKIRLMKENETVFTDGVPYNKYIPNDWRAELYLQGLEANERQERPDMYQQELLDLFDDIYEFGYYDDEEVFHYEGRFKADVKKPNNLRYFLDYLEPYDRLYGFSVEELGRKIYSGEKEKVYRLYDVKVPDFVILDENYSDEYKNKIIEKCKLAGQQYTIILNKIHEETALGTIGYSSQETLRDWLYQYTSYNETISLQAVPIYYLDANRRITVRDKKTGINGDYIISSITMPLNAGGTMAITATKALERI